MLLHTLFPLSGTFFHCFSTSLETSSDVTSSIKSFPVSPDYLIHLFIRSFLYHLPPIHCKCEFMRLNTSSRQ